MVVTMYEQRTINYNHWTFEIDQKLTKTLYSNIMWGRADAIPTKEFKNYVIQRDYLFPKEIIDLFRALGVDYKKELKLNHSIEENGLNCYEGTFYFVGELKKGNSCKIDIGNNDFVYELTPVTENFSIGFYQEDGKVFNHPLIYILYSIVVPYNISMNAYSA